MTDVERAEEADSYMLRLGNEMTSEKYRSLMTADWPEPTWEDDVLPMIKRQVDEARERGREAYRLRITVGALCLYWRWVARRTYIPRPHEQARFERWAMIFLQCGACPAAFESIVLEKLDVPAIVDSRAKPLDRECIHSDHYPVRPELGIFTARKEAGVWLDLGQVLE